MAVNPLGMNQGTNSFIRFENDGGTINTQVIDVRQGTVTSVSNLVGGTITKVEGGTLGNLVSGTINSATAVLNSGTINVATAVITTLPNLPQGSINVTAGTFVANGGSVTVQGIAGSAAAVSGNPVYAAGQGGNGTLYPLLTDTSGQLKTVMTLGTVATHAISAATITAGTLTNLTSGTINAATAVLNSGTINVATAVITTLPNLPQGSINVTAGTVTAGSIRVTLGTVGGAVASGAASSGNPNIIAGTDSGGSVYSLLVDTAGVLQINGTVSTGGAGTQAVRVIDGTVTNVGTVVGMGVVTNLTSGSVRMTVGTLTTGTLQNLVSGTINSATVVGAAGSAAAVSGNPVYMAGQGGNGTLYPLLTDTAGVLQINGTVSTGGAGTQAVRVIDGTVTSVTDVANLAKGTITKLEGGTLGLVSSIANLAAGTVTRLEQGSIIVTAGTIAAGSIVVTNGTITHGTIDAGTVRNDARTTQNILSYGTTVAATAAAYATLIGSAAVGAGTSTWVQDISLTNPAANVTCLVGFGTALNGSSVLLKGTFGTTSAVGIEKSFPKAVNAGMTNQDLVAYVSAAGTIDVNVSYLISA